MRLRHRTISPQGLAFIKGWEGYRSTRYDDGTGVQTIGYGTTSAVVSSLPEVVTPAIATQLLERAIQLQCYPAIWARRRRHSQPEFDAMCSFVYNLGPAILGPTHTIGQAYASPDWVAQVPACMPLYSDPGEAVHAGLLARRDAEAQLWRSGRY